MSRRPIPLEARDLFNEGFRLRDAGDVDAAVEYFRRGLELSPWVGKAWFVLGGLIFEKHEYRLAAEYLRNAVELRPRDELCSIGLFHALIDDRRYAEAIAEATRFLDEVGRGAECPDETRRMYRDWIADTDGMAKAWERHRTT